MTDLTAARVTHHNSLLIAIVVNMLAGVFFVLALMADSPAPMFISSVLALECFIVGNLIGIVAQAEVYDGYCRRVVGAVKELPDPPHKQAAEERDADV